MKMLPASTSRIFKTCSNCGVSWPSRDDFLTDPEVDLIGYQVNFLELEAGIFFFNHCCNTTLALEVGLFTDLYSGPLFHRRAEPRNCPQYCLQAHNLEPCPLVCECASVRQIIEKIRTRRDDIDRRP